MTLRAIIDRLRNRRRAAADPQSVLRALKNQQAAAAREQARQRHAAGQGGVN
jgi:hypothetical protein